ncbi:MAG: von Willebrand factor type A domain-containing protein [Myxococcaceae bacterium]|nr:von Willebrand factor type A domain-containing protein [Myxococcaceae bacterium]
MRVSAIAVVCVLCACSKPEAPPAQAPRPTEAKTESAPPAEPTAGTHAMEEKPAAATAANGVSEENARAQESLLEALSGLSEAKPRPTKGEAKVVRAEALGTSAGKGSVSGSAGLGLKGVGTGGGGLGALGGIGGLGGGAVSPGSSGSPMSAMARGRAAGMGSMGYAQGLAAGQDPQSSESYGSYGINGWTDTREDHLSTFAADVDTASYAVARRKILQGHLPPPSSVRVEEFVNYFKYSYPQPGSGPLAVTLDAAPSPFTKGTHLVRVGVQGRRLSMSERKPAHLTFLVDVSGSMQSPDKLPLAQKALRLLVDNLRDGDTVSLVTYAGGVRVVLPHTGLEKKVQIHEAISALTAGGGTAMSSGIELAYSMAARALDSRSLSRVIILSDGDANIGPVSHEANLKLIAGHVKEGITVTTVGFGTGNYKDDLMEQFANKGNGNHYYVDSLLEAKRIFQTELGGTLEVIAQDVKLQVDFDPAQVKRYRLVGYENRDIADRDFRDDKVDAGEIGSGHTVTALYEVELAPGAGERLCTVRVRAKAPRGVEASEQAFVFPAAALAQRFDGASADLRFATAVMGAAEVFRQSPHARGWNWDALVEIARSAAGDAAERREFVSLLESARPVLRAVASR